MKKSVIIVFLLLLSACAARYDSANYDRLVDIVVDTRDSAAICINKDSMYITYNKLMYTTVHALENSIGRDDTDVTTMLNELLGEIQRFGEQLNKGKVGEFFCKEKITNINSSARIIVRAEGSKPKR